jgi:hypothetical protein
MSRGSTPAERPRRRLRNIIGGSTGNLVACICMRETRTSSRIEED